MNQTRYFVLRPPFCWLRPRRSPITRSAAYDLTKTITSKAIVTWPHWSNPHCLLNFDMYDDKVFRSTGMWKCTIRRI